MTVVAIFNVDADAVAYAERVTRWTRWVQEMIDADTIGDEQQVAAQFTPGRRSMQYAKTFQCLTAHRNPTYHTRHSGELNAIHNLLITPVAIRIVMLL